MENNKVLAQILDELKGIKKEQHETNNRIDKMESEVSEVKNLSRATFDKVAELTEFKTEVSRILTVLSQDVDYCKHKIGDHEKDIYTLKTCLNIV